MPKTKPSATASTVIVGRRNFFISDFKFMIYDLLFIRKEFYLNACAFEELYTVHQAVLFAVHDALDA